jgi:sec-independent protein translocase protein TatB
VFDIGFFELLVIAVVGLLVIGPERLPGTIRTGALWWGRIKRSIRETRAEIEKQIGADDIRRELHNEEVMRSLEALRHTTDDVEKELKKAKQELNQPDEAADLSSDDAETRSTHTHTTKPTPKQGKTTDDE